MTDLTTLIAKLENATGPDRELDAEIAATFHYMSNMPDWVNDWSGGWEAVKSGRVYLIEDSGNRGPNLFSDSFTDSIDAAVALASRVLPGHGRLSGKGRIREDEPLYGVSLFKTDFVFDDGSHEVIGEAEHNNEAIALVIAILRAKQAEAKE